MEEVLKDYKSVIYVIVLFSILSYSIGYALYIFLIEKNNNNNRSEIAQFTETITLGLFALVFIVSLVLTKGNTSFLAPIVVLIFLVFYTNSFAVKPILKPFLFKNLLYFIFSFLLFSLGMAFLLHFDNRLLIHHDISFYSRLSHNMAEFNLERVIIDPLIVSEYPAQIYHYFNEWLTVFALKFSKLVALKSFILFTLPCLTVFIFFNLISVSEHLLKKNVTFNKVLVSLLVLASPGILGLFFNLLLKGSFETSYSVLQGGILFLKLKIIFLIMLISLKLYFTKRPQLSLIIFSLIPIFWNSVIPAFVGGLILLTVFQILEKKGVNKSLIYTNLIAFGVFGLYLFLNSTEKSESIISYSLVDYLIEEYSKFAYLGKVVLMVLVSFIPLLLLVFKKSKSFFDQEYKYFILFTAVSSFASFSLIHKLFNARQIILNFFYPLLMIAILITFIWFFNKYHKLSKVTSILMLVVLVTHSVYYSNANHRIYEIPADFQFNNDILVASDLKFNSSAFSFYVRPYSYQMLDNKYWITQRIDILDNIQFNSSVEKLEYMYSVSGQSFFKYASLKRFNIKNNNINDLKFQFLKEYRFKYLLVHEDEFLLNLFALNDNLEVSSIKRFDNNVLLLKLEWN